MSLLYADTSALACAYLPDELDHAELRGLLLESTGPVVTSELAVVELAAAMAAAKRARRIADSGSMMLQIESDLSGDPVSMLDLRLPALFPEVRRLIAEHALFALDAIHLAVALVDAPAHSEDDEVVLVTRDRRQAAAARAEGLAVSTGS